jgi:DNA-directed RNA polymerase specialized sigma24 family protein
MVAKAQVSFTAGGASYRLEGTRRDDGMVALDVRLRSEGDSDEQVVGGLLIALTDLPLVRVALDRVLADLDPTKAKTYDVEAIRTEHPAAYVRWTPEQEQRLLAEYDRGRTVDELAELLGRQPGGIRSRLQRLGRLPDDPPAARDPDGPPRQRG